MRLKNRLNSWCCLFPQLQFAATELRSNRRRGHCEHDSVMSKSSFISHLSGYSQTPKKGEKPPSRQRSALSHHLHVFKKDHLKAEEEKSVCSGKSNLSLRKDIQKHEIFGDKGEIIRKSTVDSIVNRGSCDDVAAVALPSPVHVSYLETYKTGNVREHATKNKMIHPVDIIDATGILRQGSSRSKNQPGPKIEKNANKQAEPGGLTGNLFISSRQHLIPVHGQDFASKHTSHRNSRSRAAGYVSDASESSFEDAV